MADNEGVTKAVARFYRDYSDTVSLSLSYDPRPIIIPVNVFGVKCLRFSPCHDRDFRKRTGDFRLISEYFRTIPERC